MLLVGIERQKISQFWQELAQIHNEEQIGTYLQKFCTKYDGQMQGGITRRAIDEPRKSPEAIDKRVIIDFRDKNVVIARFRDQNEVFI